MNPASAAPDVASMVKRLNEMHKRYGDTLYKDAATLLMRFGHEWRLVTQTEPSAQRA